MEKQNKFLITIGLNKSDMKTKINKTFALNVVNKTLLKYKVFGFSVNFGIGFYKGLKENNLKISFINTYGLNLKDVTKIIKELKTILNQECILLEQIKNTQYVFI